jgi:hypothetical protein
MNILTTNPRLVGALLSPLTILFWGQPLYTVGLLVLLYVVSRIAGFISMREFVSGFAIGYMILVLLSILVVALGLGIVI